MSLVRDLKYKRSNEYQKAIYDLINRCIIVDTNDTIYFIIDEQFMFKYSDKILIINSKVYTSNYIKLGLIIDDLEKEIITYFKTMLIITGYRYSRYTKMSKKFLSKNKCVLLNK